MRSRVSGWKFLFVLLAALLTLNGCESDPRTQSQFDDTAITTAVKSKLAADVRLSTATDVEVETNSGVVTLKGKVGSQELKSAAEEVARSIDGVVRVSNQLSVARNPS